MKQRRLPSFAALLHGFEWQAGEHQIYLSDGVSLGPLADTPVEALYVALCRREEIDDGDPLSYQAFIRVDPTVDHSDLTAEHRPPPAFGESYAVVDRICTLICAATRRAPWMVRIITSSDGFRSCSYTELLVGAPVSSEFIGPALHSGIIDKMAVDQVDHMWATVSARWRSELRNDRVMNALTYFYYAWRSTSMDQVCLNLAITFEILFSPHHAGETTHQLSLAVAKYLSSDRATQERTYDLLRGFYGMRSAVVHGRPDVHDLEGPTVEAFRLAAELLTAIVGNPEKADVFGDEKNRRAMLRNLMFG